MIYYLCIYLPTMEVFFKDTLKILKIFEDSFEDYLKESSMTK